MNAERDARPRPVVIVFSGLPGTGKSTLADLTAKAINAPSIAGDWLLGALAPHGVLNNLGRKVQLAVYYDLMERLVWRQLMLGQSAVVDCVITDEVIGRWRALADRFTADLLVVECVCSDQALHRQRLEGRTRGIPGWHEVDWDHVERMRVEFPQLTTQTQVLDAVRPVAENLRAVLRSAGSAGDAEMVSGSVGETG
jgi:predicted kinase